jgi:hypothetical protein
MRTTLTLEADLVKRLKELARRRGESFTRVLNHVVRQGLMAERQPGAPRYVVEPHAGGFRQGIDPTKLNQLVDELSIEDFQRKPAR